MICYRACILVIILPIKTIEQFLIIPYFQFSSLIFLKTKFKSRAD